MRVFELMEQLSEMPAGATVEFERITSVEELVKNDAIMDDDGNFYIFKTNISDVEEIDGNLVRLYGG